MIIKDPPFTVCEQLVENLILLLNDEGGVSEDTLIKSIGKSKDYIKKGISFLIEIKVLIRVDNLVKCVDVNRIDSTNLRESIKAHIRKKITLYSPFSEYIQLLNIGKNNTTSARLIISKYSLEVDLDILIMTFNNWLKYLDKEIYSKTNKGLRLTTTLKNNPFLWIDESGALIYDEEAHTNKIISTLSTKNLSLYFIDPSRITAIREINQQKYDFSKLIILCEEINDAYRNDNFYTIGALTRALIDHVPPIFGKRTFIEVANNYGAKSFRDSMSSLENFTRKISDGILHSHIKRQESLPVLTTVDCRIPLDLLLGEITTVLF